jgi:hypothetical protein
MSEPLNNTKAKPEANKPNSLVHHTWAKNLSNDSVKNNTSLYCFFTRMKDNDVDINDDTEQERQMKSPFPTTVTIIDVFKQGKPMSKRNLNSSVKSESTLPIFEKINTALSKLHRLPKSMKLFFK